MNEKNISMIILVISNKANTFRGDYKVIFIFKHQNLTAKDNI
jgi:hypothetical protein